MFRDRNAPENSPVNRLGTHERRRSRRRCRNMDESRDSRLVKENRNWQMSQCVFVKCQVLDREEGLKKIKTMEDGNRRNGYHKVKCQVPETEELRGREKGGENESAKFQETEKVAP